MSLPAADPLAMRPAALVAAVSLALALPASAEPSAERTCTIVGTPGRDVLIGTPANDVVCGLGGNDLLDGGLGNDVLVGGPGADTLDGGAGHDTLLGGPGNDTIQAWDGTSDWVDGGAGRDRAWVDRTLDRVTAVEVR